MLPILSLCYVLDLCLFWPSVVVLYLSVFMAKYGRLTLSGLGVCSFESLLLGGVYLNKI